jgi:polysaccharide export outer membrane protein
MRGARIVQVIGVALLAGQVLGGCARRQAASYVMVDPATGQQVTVAQPQTYQQPVYAQAFPQQQTYAQPQVYAQQPALAQQAYAQPPQVQEAVRPEQDSGRGLFNSRRSTTTYVQPPMQAPYVVQYGAGGYAAANPYAAYASASAAYAPSYTLDAGDKLRIVVFGQDGISNSYLVDAGGNVNLPLIGSVPARGTTPQQLSKLIAERLKQGYVREPHVSVEVEAYRPFFILGEVTNPGQYAYVASMTAETAIAIAGGFSPRAAKSKIELTRNAGGQQIHGEVPLNTPLRPGDTVVVKERWF